MLLNNFNEESKYIIFTLWLSYIVNILRVRRINIKNFIYLMLSTVTFHNDIIKYKLLIIYLFCLFELLWNSRYFLHFLFDIYQIIKILKK